MRLRVFLLEIAISLAATAGAAAQEKITVGYWTSGFSVGFGAVLEAGKFLEQNGLAPEYIRFSDVNAPTKALITHSIDAAFAAPTTGAFALAAQGAPIELVLATQIAEATFVAKAGSPLHSLADLKGKRLGMSPAGSAMYAIVSAVLERDFGIRTSDFTAVPGNEGQLVQFLQRGDVDAAALRAVTIASVPDLKLQVLGKVVDEWKRTMKSNAPPILGTALVHRDYARTHSDGARNTAQAADMLKQASNLDARDATSYARLWSDIYIASMDTQTVATFKAMADIFRSSHMIEGQVPDSLYAAAPYTRAKQQP
jgi:NitT/TauT family transport system substrate-binding protein